MRRSVCGLPPAPLRRLRFDLGAPCHPAHPVATYATVTCQLRQARGQTPQAPSDPAVLCVHCLTPLRHAPPLVFQRRTTTERPRHAKRYHVLVGTVPVTKSAPCRPPLSSLRLGFGQHTVLVPRRWLCLPLRSSTPFACHCAGALSLRATFACKCWDVPSHIDPHFLKRHFTTTGGLLQAVSGLWFGSTDAKKAVRQRTVSIGTVRCKSGDALRRKLWNDTA